MRAVQTQYYQHNGRLFVGVRLLGTQTIVECTLSAEHSISRAPPQGKDSTVPPLVEHNPTKMGVSGEEKENSKESRIAASGPWRAHKDIEGMGYKSKVKNP